MSAGSCPSMTKKHNKVIKWLNDNNPETLRNYQVHNPAYEIENNVVINNTDNVLYHTLNTDSSESESSDNIQPLNIIIENFPSCTTRKKYRSKSEICASKRHINGILYEHIY